jgi:predicted DNA-binding transcriptional regulator AlpA
MPANSPHQDVYPTLSELLAGPLHFAQYAKQFSTACREHGTDYCRALPDHEPPQSLRNVAVQDLHKAFVIGVDGKKRPLLDPMPICCQEAVTLWRQHREEPEHLCCRATVYIYNWNEEIAEGLRPTSEDKLEPCCRAALIQWRWWKELEIKGHVTVGTGHRTPIIISLYHHAMEPRRDRRSLARALDDLLSCLPIDFEAAGGSASVFGQNHGPQTAPYAAFLGHIWHRLPPPPRRPNSAEEFVSRARKLVNGTVGWARVVDGNDVSRKDERRVWDRPHRMLLRVVDRIDLVDPALRKRFLIHGRKIGERFSVPANWDYDEKRYLPVNQTWRDRIRDGDVRILKAPPKHLKRRKKRMSTRKGANHSKCLIELHDWPMRTKAMNAIASGADQILNKRQTASMIGVSVSTLDRMRKRKEFPPPIEVSLRRVGWLLSVVQAWIASRPTR